MNTRASKSIWNEKTLNVLALILLNLALFLLWIPTVNIPYWWDSAGFVIIGARNLLENNFWPLDAGIPGAYAHPVLFIALVATVWKIFGESLLVSHSINLVFGMITVTYMYLLTKHLVQNSLRGIIAGSIASTLLLITPLYYAQLGIIYLEIPTTAFALTTVYYFVKRNYPLYILSGMLLVLTKEYAGMIIGVFLIQITVDKLVVPFLKKEKLSFSSWIQESLIIASPFFVLVIWFAYHELMTGYFFIPPEVGKRAKAPFDFMRLVANIQMVAGVFFFSQWRILITIFLAIFAEEVIVRSKVRRDFWKKEIILFILIPLAAILFFGITEFLPRYFLFALPYFYILFVYCFFHFFKSKPSKTFIGISLITTVILGFLFVQSWNERRIINTWHFPPLEENLEYLDVIDLGQKTVKYIHLEYPNAIVYTAFPTDYMLSQPFQHYTNKAITTKNCREYKEGERVDLIVFHPLSPNQVDCMRLIDRLQFAQIKKFERNGKFIAIFKPSFESIYIKGGDVLKEKK